ncbi:hypothetical protein M9H77_34208 [Catharanthus roseus]|uniref:Uncharacterized protein n=1 Tax=Catharanthus roseus TaxID=4058 RepID=A0ACB9ZMD4_CATRO|nr:hypothetical protein M9H77_34208 [Catharanthus roseus]
MVKEYITKIAGPDYQFDDEGVSFKLVGFKNFIRTNPTSDLFTVKRFHHVEFWCAMPQIPLSDLSTGNSVHASYLLRSGDLNFLFTAPYSSAISYPCSASVLLFLFLIIRRFTASHGLAVRAICMEVADAESAFSVAVSRGAKPVSPLFYLIIQRFLQKLISMGKIFTGSFRFLPGFELVEDKSMSYLDLDYGIRGLDHAVGNVPELGPAVDYVKKFTGFHEFAEFTAEDVGTNESGLNSVDLANNNENVLLPMNEPVYGTKRRNDQGTLLQIFTKLIGDRYLPIIIQRVGCMLKEYQKGGCGGFGKGNFSELFKSIQE